MECVRMSHSNAWSKEPMMQLKMTALLSPELCVRQRLVAFSTRIKCYCHISCK